MLLLFVVLPIAVSIAVSSSSVASSLAFCWMCTKSSEDDEVVGDEDIIFNRLQLLRRRDDDNDSSRALIITLFCHKAMTQTCNVVLSSCPHCHCCFERFCKSGFEIGVLSHRYLRR